MCCLDMRLLSQSTPNACAAGELLCELPVVISNHADLEGVAANFGIPFRCFPLAKGASAEAKRDQVATSFMLLPAMCGLGQAAHCYSASAL